jgi:large subunit ribosomal protein L22
MSAEEEKGDVTPEEKPAAKAAAKKPAAKKPAKAAAAKGAEAKAKGADAKGKGDDAKAESTKPAAKKAAKKPAAKKAPAATPAAKEPVAEEKKAPAGKAPAKPRRKVVSAHARYVRTSARKARMVCGHLRGKSVQEARAILAFTPREVARDWSKLLESAVANAESNHELLEDDLIVREAYADEGPTIKRFRPRAMGRATPIRKRTSHLTITLTPDAVRRTTKRDG